MIFDPDPLATVRELVAKHASGELICASDTVEVHVYLQRGRIAWATDAARPLAFTRHLLDTGRVDVDVLRELLESCRRERRPLGETLIAWGVVTREDVRDALLCQIRLAFDLFHDSGPVQTLFLNRSLQFAGYDTALTFELEEVLAARAAVAPARPSSIRPDTARPPAELARPDEASLSAANHLRASIDGLLWVENDGIPEPPDVPSRVPQAFAQRTLHDGATLAALSTGRGVLAGVVLPSRRALWCFAGKESTIGAVVATLGGLAGPTTTTMVPAPEGPWWSIEGGIDGATLDGLRAFTAQAPEIHAAFVHDPEGGGATAGVGRGGAGPDALSALVSMRARALAEVSPSEDDGSAHRMMTAEPGVLLFGTELTRSAGRRFAWIVVDAACSKGLGWGYLTSLARKAAGWPSSPG